MMRRLPGWIGWPQLDMPLSLGLLTLIAIGLIVLYSASGGDIDTVQRQAARIAIGLLVLLALSQVPPHILRIWTPWLYVLGLGLVIATWVFGTGRGTSRWLDLGVVRFQPSEIMKLAVPMMMAWYLHPRRLPPNLGALLMAGAILGVPALLIARQPDLGTALLVAASGLFVLFLSGLQWRVIFGLAGLAAAAAPALCSP
jgi:rod shape determining protein RodA